MSLEPGNGLCLDDLGEIGAPRWVVDIAADYGLDVAFHVWRRLGEEASRVGDQGRIYIPVISGVLRAERNKYVRTLSQEGYSPKMIRERLQRELLTDLSICTICRIIRRI